MSRKAANQKLSKDLPGKAITSVGSAANNSAGNNVAPPATTSLWVGRSLSSSSSSSSSENSSSAESGSDNENDNNSSSSSSNTNSSSSSDSGSSSVDSESEDDITSKIDNYFREKYREKLRVVFKAELPTVENKFLVKQPTLMRIPNFMPVETKVFEEHTYQSDTAQDELKDNESRMAFISKLKTTVRWRECQNKTTGALYKESNSRFVRWSDGSETFHVGDEAFDVIRHPVSGVQNQLYLCLGNYYRQQCLIKEKITLRPKLDSNFGLSHVQGLRKRAFYKPSSNCVKILTDLTTNPILDRERKAKEEWAQTRKERCHERREQLNHCKPSVKPMRHGTASNANRSSGIRTNRNTDIVVDKYEDGSDPDYNDLENLSDDSY